MVHLRNTKLLVNALLEAKNSGRSVHFMGLLSDGGVHSHIDHLKALIDIVRDFTELKVYVHAFLDGRDTDPESGLGHINTLLEYIQGSPVRLASVIGRYYAMDRDQRWERTKKAYELLVNSVSDHDTADISSVIENCYKQGTTDEFMPAIRTLKGQEGCIKDEDLVIFFNFRSDRPRQITSVLSQEDKPDHDMFKLTLRYITMAEYDSSYSGVEVLFPSESLKNTLGEVVSKNMGTQLRIAETEKYPHVTYFFSGGREEAYPGESRILVPSPKVATYNLRPEMSAREITAQFKTHVL